MEKTKQEQVYEKLRELGYKPEVSREGETTSLAWSSRKSNYKFDFDLTGQLRHAEIAEIDKAYTITLMTSIFDSSHRRWMCEGPLGVRSRFYTLEKLLGMTLFRG